MSKGAKRDSVGPRRDADVLTRRQLIKAGAAAGGSVILSRLLSGCSDSGPVQALPEKPDFLIVITDQMRRPGMHWPPGLVATLPSFQRLAAHGLTFNHAHCPASMCGPSRACLLTGAYENVNGVQTVVSDVAGEKLSSPASGVPNLATMLAAAGYDVVYKGKWDLSADWESLQFEGNSTAPLVQEMQQTYGFSEWNPPDAGITLGLPLTTPPPAYSLATLGGGGPDNDSRYVEGGDPSRTCQGSAQPGTGCQTPGYGESALSYLAKVGRTPRGQRKPFCLVVSLTNPHDIGFYPNGYDSAGGGYPAQVPDLGVSLPDNYDDSLSTKPNIQTTYRGVVETEDFTDEERSGYVNFYPYLHQVVDREVMRLLDALDAQGLTRDTVIFRTADHGELGFSHNLIEKCYTLYSEVVDVPLIVSNPVLFPEPQVTDAFWTHVDLTATIAELAGAQRIGVGVSQVPVLRNPQRKVRDDVVYFMDDGLGVTKVPLTTPASHIRALINDRYSYGVYFTASFAGTPGKSAITAGGPYQLELYDNLNDRGQLNNLLFDPSPSILPVWQALHTRLTDSMREMNNLPPGWPTTIDEIRRNILPYGGGRAASLPERTATVSARGAASRQPVLRLAKSGAPFRGWRPPRT